jgi:hypothetical protein
MKIISGMLGMLMLTLLPLPSHAKGVDYIQCQPQTLRLDQIRRNDPSQARPRPCTICMSQSTSEYFLLSCIGVSRPTVWRWQRSNSSHPQK